MLDKYKCCQCFQCLQAPTLNKYCPLSIEQELCNFVNYCSDNTCTTLYYRHMGLHDQHKWHVGEARAIWDVGHYGKSLNLQNSESSNCMCVPLQYRHLAITPRIKYLHIVTCVGGERKFTFKYDSSLIFSVENYLDFIHE